MGFQAALVIPAVPSNPGLPLVAIPARSFLISAIARPGFKLCNRKVWSKFENISMFQHLVQTLGQVLVQFIIV